MCENRKSTMSYEKRKSLFEKIEKVRGGRVLVCFFNFDRGSNPPLNFGIATQFHAEAKEALFRVLKETASEKAGVDLCLYTRGGDTNAVWPMVSLIREFDPDFEVLVPFRCHSSGTLVALGAKRIHLGPISELSPIDPSTGNQFNPLDPTDKSGSARLPISVEDVQAYRSFIVESLHLNTTNSGAVSEEKQSHELGGFLQKLATDVHPLALGNVHRVHQQIKKLGKSLLDLHTIEGRDVAKVVEGLATRFYSHLHMISRNEAIEILGVEQVKFTSTELAEALDELLRAYEDQFQLRRPFFLSEYMGDEPEKVARFVGAVVESRRWSYLFETKSKISQSSKLPPNVQLQLPAGQRLPLIPGLPREYNMDLIAQAWIHNKEPKGVTL
jgi:Serine dehydrogenase proteinase